MAEEFNPATVEVELIETMANMVFEEVEGVARDTFIDWAMNYLQDNGTTPLSDALGNNADKYISLLELNELITDTSDFIQSCIEYYSEDNKAIAASEILSNFFGVSKDIAGMVDFETILGTYISMVFEVASFALNKGVEILEAHNAQLQNTIGLCDLAVNDPSAFKTCMNSITICTQISGGQMLDSDIISKLIDLCKKLSDNGIIIKNADNFYCTAVDTVVNYNYYLSGIKNTAIPNMMQQLSDSNTILEPETIETIKTVCNTFETCMNSDFNIASGRIIYSAASSASSSSNSASKAVYDPLVIDLGKTGFELTNIENGVHFDMNRNGLAEKTGWITGDDAFLALDRNGDGKINDSGELFGDRTTLSDGTYAKSGFEALAEYDTNLDGIINAHDEVYNQLRLWQDKNGDGISTEDELMNLNEAGVSAINLNYQEKNITDESNGSILSNISSVIFEDGTETTVGEFKFSSDQIDAIDNIDFEINEEILALPNVRSIGTVHSLHYAMAADKSGKLINLVKSFTESDNISKRESILTDILYFICDATDIDPTSRGAYMDARQLVVVEKMTGKDFWGQFGANPNQIAGPMLQQAFNELLSGYYCEMVYDDIKDYLRFIDTKTDKNGNTYQDLSFFNTYVKFNLNGQEVPRL